MSKLDPTAFCWYRSETQLGLMCLGVQASEMEQANLQGSHRVFQQAALLANTEVMIQAIELWQDIDLDLVPCEAPDNTSLHLSLQLQDNANTDANGGSTALVAAADSQLGADEKSDEKAVTDNTDEPADDSSEAAEQPVSEQSANNVQGANNESPTHSNTRTATNAHTTSDQPRIVMVFDCATLVQLKSLSQELQSVISVTSSNVELRVQLDQFSITSEELAVLDTGAVVIIPAAYQPSWGIVAISDSPDVPLKFAGSVKQSEQSLQVQFAHHEPNASNHSDSPDESSNDCVTVWCSQQCSVPIKELLGVDTTDQATQLHSLDARELHIMQGESTIANGSLLPYGRGSVVAVSERLVD